MIKWFIEKGTVLLVGVIGIMWFAGNVLGMSFSTEDGLTTSNVGIVKTANNTASCIDQIGSTYKSSNCTSITIGNTKIGE